MAKRKQEAKTEVVEQTEVTEEVSELEPAEEAPKKPKHTAKAEAPPVPTELGEDDLVKVAAEQLTAATKTLKQLEKYRPRYAKARAKVLEVIGSVAK